MIPGMHSWNCWRDSIYKCESCQANYTRERMPLLSPFFPHILMKHARLVSATLIVSLLLPNVALGRTLTFVMPTMIIPALQQSAGTLASTFANRESVTRGEFVSAIMKSINPAGSEECFVSLSRSSYSRLFTDISKDDAIAVTLCEAMTSGIIQGYPDGSFRANQPVNYAEAAKIVAKAFRLPTPQNIKGNPWYYPYTGALSMRGIFWPMTDLSSPISGSELMLVFDNLKK